MNLIPLETALNFISNAYLASVVFLLVGSYLGWMAIENIEKGEGRTESGSLLSKWFT